MEIILGTANFGNKYGTSKGLSKSEIVGLLTAAKRMGVTTLDTADTYGKSLDLCRSLGKGFKIMHKSQDINTVKKGEIAIYHNYTSDQIVDWSRWAGVSVYEPKALFYVPKGRIVSVPLNFYDLRFLPYITRPDHKVYVRSLFLRGIIPPGHGWAMLRIAEKLGVAGAIIGADSAYQFMQTVEHAKAEYVVNYERGTWVEK